MRLIDADALLAKSFKYRIGGVTTTDVVMANNIKNAPTVDAEPVRHGRWIDRHVTDFGVAEEFCGRCEDWSVGWHKRYCSNCGAKMDEEVDT